VSDTQTEQPTWPPKASSDFPRIRRLPAYVFAQLDLEKRQQVEAGADVIDLGMGNPDLPTPPHVVEELTHHAADGRHHRYSASRGIHGLREAIAAHYATRYGVSLEPETETVVTIGAKEGIAHLMLALLDQGDSVIVPTPAYPIHMYSVMFAGGQVVPVPLLDRGDGFLDGPALLSEIERATLEAPRRPRGVFLSFPHNPTTLVADRAFYEQVVDLARRLQLLVFHDFAYADSGFDVDPVSILEIQGAKEIAVEIFSMSKSYCMAGWRVGFCVGNAPMVQALTRIKSYLDYGIFQPIQIAAAHALTGPQACVAEASDTYRARRDALVSALGRNGWVVRPSPATMFLWAPIPEAFQAMGSIEFARLLLREAAVVVAPGIAFGDGGDGHVRFALIEPEETLQEVGRRIGAVLAISETGRK
jgi:alanine-synthesizing transaminase